MRRTPYPEVHNKITGRPVVKKPADYINIDVGSIGCLGSHLECIPLTPVRRLIPILFS